MKAFMVLIISLLIVEDIKADYSIDTFINFLEEKKYYDIIVIIKEYYWADVAIDVCKGLVPSNDCETFVRVYIPSSGRHDNNEKPSLEDIIHNSEMNNKNEILNLIHITKTKYGIN